MIFKYIFVFVAVLIAGTSVNCKPTTVCKYDAETIENLYKSAVKFRDYLITSENDKVNQYSHELSELLAPSENVLAFSYGRSYFTESYITTNDKNVTIGGEYTSGGVPPTFYNKNDSNLDFTEYDFNTGLPVERLRFSVPIPEFQLGVTSQFFKDLDSANQEFLNTFFDYRKKAYDFYQTLESAFKDTFYKNIQGSYRFANTTTGELITINSNGNDTKKSGFFECNDKEQNFEINGANKITLIGKPTLISVNETTPSVETTTLPIDSTKKPDQSQEPPFKN